MLIFAGILALVGIWNIACMHYARTRYPVDKRLERYTK